MNMNWPITTWGIIAIMVRQSGIELPIMLKNSCVVTFFARDKVGGSGSQTAHGRWQVRCGGLNCDNFLVNDRVGS